VYTRKMGSWGWGEADGCVNGGVKPLGLRIDSARPQVSSCYSRRSRYTAAAVVSGATVVTLFTLVAAFTVVAERYSRHGRRQPFDPLWSSFTASWPGTYVYKYASKVYNY